MSTVAMKTDSVSFPTFAPVWVTLALGFAAALVTMVPGLPMLVEYDATGIGQGQFWRILSGHLTHWNLGHLVWDLCVFLVLGTMCEWRSRSKLIACVIGTAVATSLFMLLTLPEIPTYRGLSGIDTGLFTLLGVGIYRDTRTSGDRTMQAAIVVMAGCLLAKLVFEIITGSTIFVDHSEAAFIPITASHILGAIAGIIVALIDSRLDFHESLPDRFAVKPFLG